MELFKEWFLWGESDLFFYGIALIVIASCVPWRTEKNRKNYSILIGCLLLYGFCELGVSVLFHNYLYSFLCLFIGGIALSIALGRMIKIIWKNFSANTKI